MGERLAATPIDHISNFIYRTYVLPALARSDSQISNQVAEVWKALDCVYSMDSIRDVLGSTRFHKAYNLSLAPPLPNQVPTARFSFKLGASQRQPSY